MDALTTQLMQQLSGNELSQISRQIGTDEQTAGSALSTVIPLLVSALANNASQPTGAQALHQALADDHNGSILGDMSSFLENPATANGAGILEHILGGQQPAVTSGLAQGTGLDSSQVGQLLQIVAPLVMGMLGQQQQQQGFDTDNLSAFLGSQQQQVQQSNPDIISLLNSVLDVNKSGSALDDILGWLIRLFRGR
ncbi:MAG: DUF937 domain-containing protein [Anaerolineae bacterium]|nr:DUF937 domain-containing protein [Anaerolineae bacterium]